MLPLQKEWTLTNMNVNLGPVSVTTVGKKGTSPKHVEIKENEKN